MGAYFGTTEITNFDCLIPVNGVDITQVFFATNEIFTVWAEYDGTLPAQYSANGTTLADYRIYGTAGGVGNKTENLFDPNAEDIEKECFYNAQGVREKNIYHNESGFIPVSPGEYTFSFVRKAGGSTFYVNSYDANKTFVSNIGSLSGNRLNTTVTVQDDGYVRFNFADYYLARVMFRRGGVALYVPYGYEVDMCVKSENMYNKNSEGNIRGYIASNGILHPSTQYGDNVLISEKIPVTPGEKYVMCNAVISGSGNGAAFYDDNDSVVSSFAVVAKQNYTLTAPNNAKYFRSTIIYGSDGNTFMFIEGDEYPSAFIPYSRTTTPIYIGADPLDAIGDYADYVDYHEGKIMRSVLNYVFNGTETVWRAISNYVEIPAQNIVPSIVLSSAVRSYSPDGNVSFSNQTYGSMSVIRILVAGISVAADIMPYLKSLYDNGTPAVMWYASSEPIEVDPPVSLPALPTVDSVTITDYAGQSAAPSRFYAKYRKEGY